MFRTLLLGFFACSAHAELRDWTSADGSKTFRAQVTAFHKDAQIVTMDVDGQILSFRTNKLSEADRDYLASWDGKVPSKTLIPSKSPTISELLNKDKLMRLKDKKFVESELVEKPTHYLLYYSASW